MNETVKDKDRYQEGRDKMNLTEQDTRTDIRRGEKVNMREGTTLQMGSELDNERDIRKEDGECERAREKDRKETKLI